MSKECKLARNVVLIPLAIIIALCVLSSCASTANCGPSSNVWGAATNCPAYR